MTSAISRHLNQVCYNLEMCVFQPGPTRCCAPIDGIKPEEHRRKLITILLLPTVPQTHPGPYLMPISKVSYFQSQSAIGACGKGILFSLRLFKSSRMGHSVKVSLWCEISLINTRFRFFIF